MRKLTYNKVLVNFFDKIRITSGARQDDILLTYNGKELKISGISQKQVYEEALNNIGRLHHSQLKWVERLKTTIDWDTTWESVHNILSTNKAKTTVWQQIHLNFYTQYSYNRWHKSKDPCPLCLQTPHDIYHLILDCDFTNALWEDLQPLLKELHPAPITEEEKSFGLIQKKKTNGILLRNWITYLTRDCVSQEEREAYTTKTPNLEKTKAKLNRKMHFEINKNFMRFKNEQNLASFEKIITHANVLCRQTGDDKYELRQIFEQNTIFSPLHIKI